MGETRKTFCRFCHASCAILVEVEQGVPVSVRGDPDDPVFRGYTCIKGRELANAHTHPSRLRSSVKRTANGFEPLSSEQALDEIAARLREIVDRHGPHSVAIYCGTMAFLNSAGVPAGKAFAKAIGTRNFYSSITIDQPAKTFVSPRLGNWAAGFHAAVDADVVMAIGNNPLVSHFSAPGTSYGQSPSRQLRDALANGRKLIVLDPRQTETARLATIHLQLRPGTDAILLAAICKIILDENLHDSPFCDQWVNGLDDLRLAVAAFDVDRAAAWCDVPAADILAAARMFAAGPRGCVGTATGPEMSGDGTLVEHLAKTLNIICGRVYRAGERAPFGQVFMPPPGGPFRAQVVPPKQLWGPGFAPSRIRNFTALGDEMPCSIMADEILTPGDGQIRALITIGGNPVIAFPDQNKIVRALDSLELLVSADIRLAQTSHRAHYVLAPRMSLEREDVTFLLDRAQPRPYARYTDQIVPAPGDVLDEWEMLWGLAKRLGLSLEFPGGPCPMDRQPTKEEALDLMYPAGMARASQVRQDAGEGAVIYGDGQGVLVAPADPDADARFELNPDGVLSQLSARQTAQLAEGFSHTVISRRTRGYFNSSGQQLENLHAVNPTNHAHMHPDDLSQLGLEEGDIVEIDSGHARVLGVVKASPDVKPGSISMAHAFGDVDTNAGTVRATGDSVNRLAPDDAHHDPITGMPRLSAIPVKVRAHARQAAAVSNLAEPVG